ncbi:endonuclease/exonuclease/phosphatase family protein [Kitasatospora sp. NBC_01250]|uniref:endonuclease/exonuclease/phosphatase family protein n=1 Tax=Kitasatospora sp. NBC_01250 TaxID=2903571 RepID=UPI003FA5CC59
MPAGPRTGAARSLTIATLNTRGTPLLGTHRAERSAAVGAEFEHSPVEVVGFPEVHTYQHVRQPRAALPAFPHVAYARTPVGPAGGLAIFSPHCIDFILARRGHRGRARGADPRPADRDALRPRLRLRPPRPARGPAGPRWVRSGATSPAEAGRLDLPCRC